MAAMHGAGKGAIITMATGKLVPVETLKALDVMLEFNGPSRVTAVAPVKNSKLVALELADGKKSYCSPVQKLLLAETRSVRKLKTVVASKAKGAVVMTMKGPLKIVSVKKAKDGTIYPIIGPATYCADGIWAVGEEE